MINDPKDKKDNEVFIGSNKELLKKIEELTLYVVEQNKKLEKQQLEINVLKQQVLQNHRSFFRHHHQTLGRSRRFHRRCHFRQRRAIFPHCYPGRFLQSPRAGGRA